MSSLTVTASCPQQWQSQFLPDLVFLLSFTSLGNLSLHLGYPGPETLNSIPTVNN